MSLAVPEQTNEVCYHLHAKAAEELREFIRTKVNSARIGLITTDQARYLIAEKQKELFAQALVVSDVDRRVCVVCPDCKRKHVMAASISIYRCPCSPKDRSTFVSRVEMT